MRNDTGGPDVDARLEARLEDWGRLTRAATGQQPVPYLVPTPPRRPSGFGWQLAAGVLVVAIAAASAVGLPRLLGKDRGPADPLADLTGTASAGPGMQVVTFHGLSITVPSSWPVGGYRCGVDHAALVELPSNAAVRAGGPLPNSRS